MAQWSNVDNLASAPTYAPAQRKKKNNSTNVTEMYGNTSGPGIFGVAPGEIKAMEGAPTHAGWILRTTGTGGRAGRVQYETLVAMGSISGDNEDVATPDVLLTFTSQPENRSIATGSPTTFVVAATAEPVTAITYQWQLSTGGAYSNIINGGVYSGATTATLSISDVAGLNNNRYRCVISAAAATPKNSVGARLTVT